MLKVFAKSDQNGEVYKKLLIWDWWNNPLIFLYSYVSVGHSFFVVVHHLISTPWPGFVGMHALYLTHCSFNLGKVDINHTRAAFASCFKPLCQAKTRVRITSWNFWHLLKHTKTHTQAHGPCSIIYIKHLMLHVIPSCNSAASLNLILSRGLISRKWQHLWVLIIFPLPSFHIVMFKSKT